MLQFNYSIITKTIKSCYYYSHCKNNQKAVKLVFEISLWSPSILWYRWTFQGEKGSLLWEAYFPLDSRSLITAVTVSKSRHN